MFEGQVGNYRYNFTWRGWWQVKRGESIMGVFTTRDLAIGFCNRKHNAEVGPTNEDQP